MLGDVSPQNIRITAQAVVYPGRDHVVRVTVEKTAGQRYVQTDLTAITRAVLVFPETDPTITYDSQITPTVFDFTAGGGVMEIDLSDFAMPASIYESYLILFDAEHTGGQVIVDNDDTKLVFDFRNVSTTGAAAPPTVSFVTEAPTDGNQYVRQNSGWVSLGTVITGVTSVNGLTGVVVINTDNVPEGVTNKYYTDARAQALVNVHVADTTPHDNILNLTKVGFNVAGGGVATDPGDVVWNNTDMTLDIGLGGGVTLQAGQELQVRGLNNSGVTMLNGRAVFISGASGNRVVFSLAQANQSTAGKTIAVLTQDILNNQQGQATVVGLVRDIDTSAFAEGNELWLSATVPGGVTNIRPVAPNSAVRLGYVVRSHLTLGSIFVRVTAVEALNDLQDVVITTPADGDIIKYNTATSTWINSVGGAGEANTASNLGAGSGVFAQKVATDLQFKSLVAGANITLTPAATTITIASTGGSGSALTIQDEGVSLTTAGTLINFVGAGVTVTEPVADQVTVTVPGAPVTSVDGQTGAVSLSASYAPLSHVGDTGAAHGNASTSVAGFMSGADKTKLDGIAPGAQVNVPTNLTSTPGASTVVIASSTGDDATVLAATTSLAGVMTAADKTKLDGVATGANLYVHPNHSGDVTSVGDGVQTIANNAVTNAKAADMAVNTIKGRITSGTGDPEDLTAAQVRTIINVADGATALPAVATFTGNKSLVLVDNNTYNVSQDGTAQVVTVPAQASIAWLANTEIHIEQGGTGTVTVTGATGVTINGVSAGSFALAGQYAVVTLKRIGLNAWTLIGGIASAVVTGPASSGDGNLVLFNGTTGKVIKDGGTVTAAGLALLDDASAAAQRTTLGVGTGDSPTFTALTLTNGQIVFPATQVPSANANTLDDYEEGTWTPTLTFATPGDLVVVYSTQAGTYTKVGRMVRLGIAVTTSTFTHTTASGECRFSGMPFVQSSATAGRGWGASQWRGVTNALISDLALHTVDSGVYLRWAACASGSTPIIISAVDMPTGGVVNCLSQVVYEV